MVNLQIIRSSKRRKPWVFISSTVYDLADVRSALKDKIERTYKYGVLLSESSDFPVAQRTHSYQACLKQVRKAELLVLLIDTHYGSEYESESGFPISITRKEVRVARKSKVPVMTFARRRTLDERDRWKQILKRKNIETSDKNAILHAFRYYKKKEKLHAQSPWVYEFLDEVDCASRDNWIHKFETSGELLETFHSRFTYFLEEYFPNVSLPLATPLNDEILTNLEEAQLPV